MTRVVNVAAAGTEDLVGVHFAAVGTGGDQVRHVLNDADHSLLHHRRHGAGTLSDLCGCGLRGGDDQHLGVGQLLAK